MSEMNLEWEKKQFEKYAENRYRQKIEIFKYVFPVLPNEKIFLEWQGWLARAELSQTRICEYCNHSFTFHKCPRKEEIPKIRAQNLMASSLPCRFCKGARGEHRGVEHKCPKRK